MGTPAEGAMAGMPAGDGSPAGVHCIAQHKFGRCSRLAGWFLHNQRQGPARPAGFTRGGGPPGPSLPAAAAGRRGLARLCRAGGPFSRDVLLVCRLGCGIREGRLVVIVVLEVW